jgi:hypothetical protein
MNKHEIVEQTNLAYDFLQKLYLETSYLIKEVEGLLSKEDEEFIIGRPSGYSITSYRSAGLESVNIDLWLLRKMAVFFVPRTSTLEKGGQTFTAIDDKAKVIYMKIVLNSKNISEPTIYTGILNNFQKKGKAFPEKVEQLMSHIEYKEAQVFKDPLLIDYEDGYLSFKGNLFAEKLFDINSGEDVIKKIVFPVVQMYRKS